MVEVIAYPISSNTTVTQFSNLVTPTQTTANHYLNFDEITPDESSSIVGLKGSAHAWELCKFGDTGITEGIITNVRVNFRANYSTSKGYIRSVVGGQYTGVGTTKTTTASYQTFTEDYTINPVSGVAWTWADLYGDDSLWIGVDGWASASKSTCRLTQMNLTITYTEPTESKLVISGLKIQRLKLS